MNINDVSKCIKPVGHKKHLIPMVTKSQKLQILLWFVAYLCNCRKCSVSLIGY